MTNSDNFLLQLLKASFQDIPLSIQVSEEDLSSVVDLAEQQGVAGLVFDALGKLPKEQIYHSQAYHQAMFSFMKMESRYPEYHKAVEELDSFFHTNGFQMMVFKGEDMRRNWMKPELRPTGDIDISLRRTKDEGLGTGDEVNASEIGDRLVGEKLRIPVKKSRMSRHSHFVFNGFSVENHYEFTDLYYGGKRAQRLEKRLQELARGEEVKADRLKVKEPTANSQQPTAYTFPSSDFNAVFLMWHLSTHFCGEAVSLRQLYDWLMFLRVHHSEIEWTKVEKAWDDAGMKPFAEGINGLLIKYLGADKAWFPEFTMDEVLSDSILNDILHGPRRDASGISNVLHYFKSNWKYKICTGHSWVRPTLSSAWMHLVHREDLEEKKV